MWDKFSEHWPFWLLSLFAVVSGQIGRLGYQGKPITKRVIWIELSMLPAFGSVGGSFAAEHDAPAYMILLCGVAAGWLGFACFAIAASFVISIMQTAAERFLAARRPARPDSEEGQP